MDARIVRRKKEVEGTRKESRWGHFATIIDYRNTFDVLIEFDSGYRTSLEYRSFKEGYFKDPTIPSVLGVGINDADYVTQPVLPNGKRAICPFYRMWKNMLTRCYDEAFKEKHYTYQDCSCDESWLRFSNFKRWAETFDYDSFDDKLLDKDIKVVGNKVYSPETCLIVDQRANQFVLASNASRGEYPIGVYWRNSGKSSKAQFVVKCQHYGESYSKTIGRSDCQWEAHKMWQTRKHELACQLAEEQTDERVAKALRERYAPDKDWREV